MDFKIKVLQMQLQYSEVIFQKLGQVIKTSRLVHLDLGI